MLLVEAAHQKMPSSHTFSVSVRHFHKNASHVHYNSGHIGSEYASFQSLISTMLIREHGQGNEDISFKGSVAAKTETKANELAWRRAVLALELIYFHPE